MKHHHDLDGVSMKIVLNWCSNP